MQAALDAIEAHVARGDLSDGLVFDAVRVRLVEIGEEVKALPDDLLATEPGLPWAEIARMRDHLAHRYFDPTHAIVAGTVSQDLPELRQAMTDCSTSSARTDRRRLNRPASGRPNVNRVPRHQSGPFGDTPPSPARACPVDHVRRRRCR